MAEILKLGEPLTVSLMASSKIGGVPAAQLLPGKSLFRQRCASS